MRCPWCNNNNTVEVVFGERTPEIKQMEKWGHCVHASKLGVIPVSDDLQYCKDCKKVFSYKDYPPVDTDELSVYYATIRMQYLPEKIKYLILNEAPPTMYMGEAPAFSTQILIIWIIILFMKRLLPHYSFLLTLSTKQEQ